MAKLFVLAHPAHRFRDDFFPCGTIVRRAECSQCGANLNRWVAPLQYWWDREFGDPQASLDARHHCFWGQFRFMVDQAGKSLLEQLPAPFTFHGSTMAEGEPLEGQQALSLHLVRIDVSVDADPVESKNRICALCGTFIERRRPITRLRIHNCDVPEHGVFTVRQNGDSGPLFASENGREMLVSSGIRGIGFYPAGRVIG